MNQKIIYYKYLSTNKISYDQTNKLLETLKCFSSEIRNSEDNETHMKTK